MDQPYSYITPLKNKRWRVIITFFASKQDRLNAFIQIERLLLPKPYLEEVYIAHFSFFVGRNKS